MHSPINHIVQRLFKKNTLEEVQQEELEGFIEQYPYSQAGRYLLAQKTNDNDPHNAEKNEQQTAALYFSNPLWLQWLLRNPFSPAAREQNDLNHTETDTTIPLTVDLPEPTVAVEEEKMPEPEPTPSDRTEQVTGESDHLTSIHQTGSATEVSQAKNQYLDGSWKNDEPEEPPVEEPEIAASGVPEKTIAPAVEDDRPITFQSYHTIDYFASQGIRLQQSELGKDKLGQQLKSFTEWLKSMKKLPSAVNDSPDESNPDDATRRQYVSRIAEYSVQEREVITEAMAEVWAKQGNTEKALAIYTKLSLQNPHKNAYFAAKIDQLKVL